MLGGGGRTLEPAESFPLGPTRKKENRQQGQHVVQCQNSREAVAIIPVKRKECHGPMEDDQALRNPREAWECTGSEHRGMGHAGPERRALMARLQPICSVSHIR